MISRSGHVKTGKDRYALKSLNELNTMGQRASLYLFSERSYLQKLPDFKLPGVPLAQVTETKTHLGHIHWSLM